MHTVAYYSTIERVKSWHLHQNEWDGYHYLNEISQAQRSIFSFICGCCYIKYKHCVDVMSLAIQIVLHWIIPCTWQYIPLPLWSLSCNHRFVILISILKRNICMKRSTYEVIGSKSLKLFNLKGKNIKI